MKVTHNGPFRTLPRRDQLKIAAAFPFALIAAAALGVTLACASVLEALAERLFSSRH